jgi:hypothetical protein
MRKILVQIRSNWYKGTTVLAVCKDPAIYADEQSLPPRTPCYALITPLFCSNELA